MSDDGFFGNMPYLATMPSCVFYMRPFGANGGSTLTDWSPNHATITNSGGVNSTTQSKFSPCSVFFNGASNTAVITQGTKLNFGSHPYAVSLWAYMTANDGLDGNVLQIGQHGSGQTFWELELISGTNIQLNLYNSGYLYQATKTIGSILNAWHHIFARYDGTYANVWLDGSQGTQSAAYTGGVFPTGNININRSWETGSYAYNTAYYDEITIWNGAYGPVPTISDIYTGHGYQRRLIVG